MTSGQATNADRLTDEEVRVFRAIYETHLLSAIVALLEPGASVGFHRRKDLVITTWVEVPAHRQQEIITIVADKLGPDLYAKVSIMFFVGQMAPRRGV